MVDLLEIERPEGPQPKHHHSLGPGNRTCYHMPNRVPNRFQSFNASTNQRNPVFQWPPPPRGGSDLLGAVLGLVLFLHLHLDLHWPHGLGGMDGWMDGGMEDVASPRSQRSSVKEHQTPTPKAVKVETVITVGFFVFSAVRCFRSATCDWLDSLPCTATKIGPQQIHNYRHTSRFLSDVDAKRKYIHFTIYNGLGTEGSNLCTKFVH